ncbi:SoxR reducing system RseC family protein [Uliginosibacterium paludis]|uniref:SoxR reducing system RseC family protein n=1 Tax=Uliginosibacterium paludis TaxID=1615952 RepID=A0ABV2CLK4_9RHOO
MASSEVRILAIRGTTLVVESHAAAACGSCRSKRQCGTDAGTLRQVEVPLADAGQLQVADTVSLSLPSGELLRMAASLYLPPALGLVLGMVAGAAGGDAASLAGGALGLMAGLLASRWLGRRAGPVVHRAQRVPGHAVSGSATGSSCSGRG